MADGQSDDTADGQAEKSIDEPLAEHDAAAAPPRATVVTETAIVAGPELKKKDFVERVVTRSGLKKRDAKLAAEAALAVLGEAIANGEELNLPPLGKLKINRRKAQANGMIYVCRLRRPDLGNVAAKEPLADPAEDG
ncbi:DNA-binding protein HU, putative [Oceanicola granulosus HTCC2516]|uniref:DNA-binding protein HU, putative n=1 Tax=Oceanicola granulosus (strain ATCC BAA-861 / DSM 15982 / KCTC 12143 / HTCC2516) TaxID=314256 RepID=Q2CFW3_OCEGH|nr:HU family DNA-binding protein [Oceanicola granulosus]EAR51579.1 DNA-binding protein HU, putative [Oceanicola granulosus HTCC2516]